MDKVRLIAVIAVFFVIVLVSGSIFLTMYKPKSVAKASSTNKVTNLIPKIYTYKIEKTFTHDTEAFTEGLTFYDKTTLLEGTGLLGVSSIRKVALASGDVIDCNMLGSSYFGEGVTLTNDSIIQLTWQTHVGFVYNKTTLALEKQFTYATEGWGLTYDGKNLIMSDGSSKLYFLNDLTFQVEKEITVHDDQSNVSQLNELEYVNGSIYANIWLQNKIAIIQPETGEVSGYIDMSNLYSSGNINHCLNGIAYNPADDTLIVTGKDWPNLYQIQLIPIN
jgi:glutaminyl-peptide cyclotransferase